MTIFFSTNIPEMRAISTFNRLSKDIASIQERITTGQRINSGKDDPGGLLVRERMRTEIKNVQAQQQTMNQAVALTDTAASGLMQLQEILYGDPTDPSNNGIAGLLAGEINTTNVAAIKTAATNFIKAYDSALGATQYNGQQLLNGALSKTYTLGKDSNGISQTLAVSIDDMNSTSLASALTALDGTSTQTFAAQAALEAQIDGVSGALAKLGFDQQVIALNTKALDSRLTSVTASEGLISNADIATESSRLARTELMSQNAMNSIMYNRSYAAFAVSSLFG